MTSIANNQSLNNFAYFLFAIFMFVVTLLPAFTPLILVTLAVIWIIQGEWQYKRSYLWKNKFFLLLPLFYLLHLAGMLYTNDYNLGWRKLETLLTMLLFPLIFTTFRGVNNKEQIQKYTWIYVFGILANFLFCIIRSSSLFVYELYCRKNGIELETYPYTNHFFYSYLSYFMHYGYMAMYVNLAIIILMEMLLKNSLSAKLKKLAYILLLAFSIYVLMLYSKAGIIALLFIYLYYAFFMIKRKGNIKAALGTLVAVMTLVFILFKYVPYTSERIEGMVNSLTNSENDPNSHESTQLRIFAWKASKEIAKDNWILGLGTGDANVVLRNTYELNNYSGAYELNINCHNQFLQTLLTVGILGVLTLTIYFIMFFIKGVKAGSFTLQVFVLITVLAFMAESFLETQKGVYYTAILSTFILFKEISSDES